MNDSEILKNLLCTMPMDVDQAYPYFGTFVRIYLTDVNGKKLSIRIYLCDWKFFDDAKELATSDSDKNMWKDIIGTLVGGKLMDISQSADDCIELLFDSGRSFRLNANLDEYEESDEMFILFVPDEYAVGYSPLRGFRKDMMEQQLH